MPGEMKRAIKRICDDLGLPSGDSFTQDWAYELPEEYRTNDYLNRYAAAYSTPGYGDAEKRLLMQLALDIANDEVARDPSEGENAWSKLADLLRSDRTLHADLIEHWALPGEPLEDAFPLTRLVRGL